MTNASQQAISDPHPRKTEKMNIDDLIDLIEIALELAMRLGHAEAASYLYQASGALPQPTQDQHRS